MVNAVAHRDYDSNASVQVMLFSDRLEVWNPGELPPSLTLDDLRGPHASIPRNPLRAEPLFLTRYIEKAGTRTLDMIARCSGAGLPEPAFTQRGGQFIVTLWRGGVRTASVERLTLNDRQKLALDHVRKVGRITESNTVEQMILDTVSSRAHGAETLVVHESPGVGWGGSLEAELRPTRWEYVPGAQLPRQSGDVMVEPWVRDALIRLNPEIAAQPDRADQVIDNLRACILSVQADKTPTHSSSYEFR